jgi:WXG100 family type VII secretion target
VKHDQACAIVSPDGSVYEREDVPMAETIQYDYEQLNTVESKFSDLAEQARKVQQKVAQQEDVLRNGAWIGPNADKFMEVMDNQLLPANQRLAQALDKASETTRAVTKMMKDAEEESKGYFPA